MPAGRSYTRPADHTTRDGDWPHGPFADVAPAYATTTAALVANLQRAIDQRGWTIRGTARAAGIAHTTLLNLLNGHAVPDLATIRALETALNTPLWPTYEPE